MTRPSVRDLATKKDSGSVFPPRFISGFQNSREAVGTKCGAEPQVITLMMDIEALLSLVLTGEILRHQDPEDGDTIAFSYE